MTDHVSSLLALYWATVGSVAAFDYLTGWNILSDGLGLSGGFLTVLYLLWFVSLLKGLPEHFTEALT